MLAPPLPPHLPHPLPPTPPSLPPYLREQPPHPSQSLCMIVRSQARLGTRRQPGKIQAGALKFRHRTKFGHTPRGRARGAPTRTGGRARQLQVLGLLGGARRRGGGGGSGRSHFGALLFGRCKRGRGEGGRKGWGGGDGQCLGEMSWVWGMGSVWCSRREGQDIRSCPRPLVPVLLTPCCRCRHPFGEIDGSVGGGVGGEAKGQRQSTRSTIGKTGRLVCVCVCV